MFNTTRAVQIDSIKEVASKLKSKINHVLKTRTIELDDKMFVDTVSILPLGTEVSDIKAMHRISQDSRIVIVSSSIENKEGYMILRFRLSFKLQQIKQVKQEKEDNGRPKEYNQWYEDMRSDVEESILNDKRIEEAEKAAQEKAIQIMSYDYNQDLFEFDYNQDTEEQSLTVVKDKGLWEITKEMNRKDKLEKLRENINIIQNNNKVN